MADKAKIIQGRGAQHNPHNGFHQFQYQREDSFLEHLAQEGEDTSEAKQTKLIPVHPKTILNRVESPDIGRAWSMNPYQGCEHGCTYCYARNSHQYWGYSAGRDFEEIILYKANAAQLLSNAFQKSNWQVEPIMLSGNTDCYQPCERDLKITRSILEVLLRYKHPVGIITKNTLIQRDLDILKDLAELKLVHLSISFTSLDEGLRRKLEPRTSTSHKKLKLIEQFSKAGIPINIMCAPVIPALNSHEILPIAKATSEAGALAFNHTTVRLNGQIAEIFTEWLQRHFPDRASKVLEGIKSCHGGTLNDSRFGTRMRGEGHYAQQIADQVKLARKRYFAHSSMPAYNTTAFVRAPKGQLGLF